LTWFRRAALVALLTVPAVLSACGSKREPACPSSAILSDASKVTRFQGAGRDLTDVVNQGEILEIGVSCKYEKNAVVLTLQVAVAGQRGPADRTRKADFEYFVAILDPAGNIVTKEPFRVNFDFPPNRERLAIVDELEPRIPLKDLAQGPGYGVRVGFQLTQDELDWNRKRPGG
jgi:hypothetical protein